MARKGRERERETEEPGVRQRKVRLGRIMWGRAGRDYSIDGGVEVRFRRVGSKGGFGEVSGELI